MTIVRITDDPAAAVPGADRLTHLQRLEAESIHIMREVVAECERPVMMYSIGKDSSVMLHLAMKAFHPARPPFPFLHVDTTWKFREMIAFRDETANRLGIDLHVHINQAGVDAGIGPFTHGSALHTDIMKTEALKQALDKYGFDAAFGGARRDEEKSRAKERIFSIRSAQHRWDPKQQRPELWHNYNTRTGLGETIRVFPLSNWTELDIWQYIYAEQIPIVPLYFAKERPVVERDGALIMVDDDRMPLRPGEVPQMRSVRFRTLGCYPLTGAIESTAITLAEIIQETLLTRHSERQGRVIDHDQSASMEKKKQEGVLLMAGVRELIATDIEQYLKLHEQKSLLRFITCGSVDDGKSTLIGRLLYECKMIFDDQLSALEADSRRVGTRGEDLDFALLVDGLAAEREQGITIDVAYRFFATDKRKFIVADTPGHEQYTRNMATGASTADLAVILIDARKGVLTQTRRHSYLVSLVGIKRVVLAINKMDLVEYSSRTFADIEASYREFAARIGLTDITCIPLSAVHGDNIVDRSVNTPWYSGPTLLEHLESIEVDRETMAEPFRMPVQWVARPNLDFRGFAGLIASGSVEVGMPVRIVRSGLRSRVARVFIGDQERDRAVAGQSVLITLADEVDVSRGDVIAAGDAPIEVADAFETTVIWMHEQPMLPGRTYLIRLGTQTTTATITPLKYKINVNTLEHTAATTLELNDIGVCNMELGRPIAFAAYKENRELGGFIVIDRLTNNTIGAGLIHFSLRRAQNVHWQSLDVNKAARAESKAQRPCVLWFTGISGAGKSTIANLVEKKLHALGRHTYLLDGDNVRHGLNKDLGFTEADRVENIRRVAEVAKLMVDAGLIVLASFISPFKAERRMARALLQEGEFFEVFIDTPIKIAERRDPKGLYKKARRGELKNFTGIDSPYELPDDPEVRVDTTGTSAEEAAVAIIAELRRAGILTGGDLTE